MSKKVIETHLCVIGAGSAGLSMAAGASQLGIDTVLIERDKMGGDCLNTGCVPSKALLKAAKAADNIRSKSKKFGIKAQKPDIDFAAVKKHVSGVIKAIEPHDSVERFEGMGVNVLKGSAQFLDPYRVELGDQVVKARKFVIATGSRASIPPIKGADPDKVLTNENIFDLKTCPKHLIIIGGGPIGIEMGQAHRRLGAKVTILDMGSIMPKDDPEFVQVVRQHLLEDGIDLYESIEIKKVEHKPLSVSVQLKNGVEISGSHLLIAAGRQPNLDLNLDAANIDYDKRGIKTDDRLRTSQKHIYAAGDVAGGPQFTHIAGYHAGIIIRNMLFKTPAKVDYAALPWVTYCDPELANVGMTEDMAREKYGDDIQILRWSMEENDRAQTERATDGKAKVILKPNGKILGAQIVAPNAGDLIQIWGLAISQGLKIGAIANMISPYPTFGEANKRIAGSYYTPKLFSDKTRFIVKWLNKILP